MISVGTGSSSAPGDHADHDEHRYRHRRIGIEQGEQLSIRKTIVPLHRIIAKVRK